MRKVCDENERKKKQLPRKYFLRWKEDFIRLHQKSGGTDFDKLQGIVLTLNESSNSLVMSESKPYGWFVVHRCKTSAIKFAMAGSQN